MLLLEDGFLRSVGLGVRGAPAWSLIMDGQGVHYDATAPSDLEASIERGDFSEQERLAARHVIRVLREEGLSKYNDGLPPPPDAFEGKARRVLVVDQTAGDLSLVYGGVDQKTFAAMLDAALEENPESEIWVKTHPDVLAGKRQGCLPRRDHPRLRRIADNWHPHDLLAHFDKVYVATSLMGFDALIRGREVHCFGLPFYAGWGLTVDRQTCSRRTRRATLEEVVAAAFVRHMRYLDPRNTQAGTFDDVARYLARERQRLRQWQEAGEKPFSGRVFAFGFQRWKRAMVRPFFGAGAQVHFVNTPRAARRLGISARDRIAVWGMRDPAGLRELAREHTLSIVRVEDGFLRSVGLGSDFIPPWSLMFDPVGIYFDAAGSNIIERCLLKAAPLPDDVVKRARNLREKIIEAGLSKYNFPKPACAYTLPAKAAGKRIVLVPGQVESDAAVLLGGGEVRTNLELLRRVRALEPEAFIIYKPHPEILAGNRKGRGHVQQAQAWCDHIERDADLTQLLDEVDAVHVITSLAGFDALLRGREVHCHGMPFYAGWGLTIDHQPITRPRRPCTLDELVAAALIMAPVYADPCGGILLSPDDVVETFTKRLRAHDQVIYMNHARMARRIWHYLLSWLTGGRVGRCR